MSSLEVAEKKMSEIEARLAELETNNTKAPAPDSSIVEEAITNYQKQMLTKLQKIRELIVSEGGDISTVREERDRALAENAQMKKEIERLNYRVRHLVKSLNEEEAKNSCK